MAGSLGGELIGPEPADPGFADLGFARVDTDRERRQGLPEVVYGPGKQVHEIAAIVRRLLARNDAPSWSRAWKRPLRRP